MQMGYNTDIEHRGVTVHVQTEDHMEGDDRITTQVFHSGRILDARTVSYANAIEGIEGDTRREEITKRMRALHAHYLKRVRDGEYDDKLPVDPSTPAATEAPTQAPKRPEPPKMAKASTVSQPLEIAPEPVELQTTQSSRSMELEFPKAAPLSIATQTNQLLALADRDESTEQGSPFIARINEGLIRAITGKIKPLGNEDLDTELREALSDGKKESRPACYRGFNNDYGQELGRALLGALGA